MKKNAKKRLISLNSKGYFPNELPPPFFTKEFGENAAVFAIRWGISEAKPMWTTPEAFNAPRFGDARRKLALVNPVNQLQVSAIISENWKDLRKHLKASEVSEFNPKILIQNKVRAIPTVNFDFVKRKTTKLLAKYGRYVKTDVTRFYGSIYTHSIPWAVLGKVHSKSSHNSVAFKVSYPNKLDKAVSASQEGQTIGIPIGPDTSRIISELIAVKIEELASQNIKGFDKRALRYVDDFIVGLEEGESSKEVLSNLTIALNEYELELNALKTGTFGLGKTHTPEWIHYIRTFNLSSSSLVRQREDMDSFFEQSLYLAEENQTENVLLFALKRASSFRLLEKNQKNLIRWMIYCMRRSDYCWAFVCEYLAENWSLSEMPKKEIKQFILTQVPKKASSGHTSELSWLLFLSREIKLKLPADKLSKVVKMRSSVVGLLILDMLDRNLIKGNLDLSFWQSFANAKGLKSDMWLIAYEATLKKWWGKLQSDQYLKSDKYFKDLYSKKIKFYDPALKVKPRRRERPISRLFKGATYASSSIYPF